MVGDLLRTERERQKLTIADVEKGTSIRGYYIESIEQGNVEALPGMAYAKGFVRKYAGFLGLDADAVIQEFSTEQSGASSRTEERVEVQPRKLEKVVPVREKPVSINDIERKQSSSGTLTVNRYEGKSGGSGSWKNILLAAVVLLVVGGAGVLYFSSGHTIDVHILPETTAGSDDKKDDASKKDAPPAEKKAEEKAAPEQPKADGVELTLDFTDRCWTEVTVDGKTAFEGTAEKGKSMTFKGKERVHIRAGNAGAMQVALNGRKMGAAGNVGQVIDREYTPTGETVSQAEAPAKEKPEEPKSSTRTRR
ncbi:DUF4115 domain-containing protein [Selenomonas sp. TAMA-11512]|uniref:helix-turn-helix domain-containing protein n=1 Tax=Selenomonas sp. TAMA-11512 TaxID=3095337 RepID=UPI003085604F|nr:DUF4115 domain-containing protein [Selenomonas sp. TAMA-11512]